MLCQLAQQQVSNTVERSREEKENVSNHGISPHTCPISSYFHLWRLPEPDAASINHIQNVCMPSGRLFEEKEQESKDFPLSCSLTCCIFSKHILEKNLQKAKT